MRDPTLTLLPSVAARGEASLDMPESPAWDKEEDTAGWLFVPQAAGVAARASVWIGLFAILLFGLFTYPALLVGGFLLVALFMRYLRGTDA